MKTPRITLYFFVIKIAFMDKAMNSRGHWYVLPRQTDVSGPKTLGACSVTNGTAVYAPGQVESLGMNLLLDTGSA